MRHNKWIRDEATLPVKFEPRLVELRIDRETIDQGFEELAQQNNLNEEEKRFISQKAGKLAHLLKAPKRITAIAEDISTHYQNHVAPKQFKGMVVVYDREAVVRMYYLLCERLGKDAVEVVMNISQGTIEEETDENGKPKKIATDWLNWQKLGLPIEKGDFKRRQGIDASPEVQEQLLDRYRDATDPLKVIIVTAKLLTGFDAPICYCMYLDKPLKDHTLLQAMCRTNRLYSDTQKHGLIIITSGCLKMSPRHWITIPRKSKAWWRALRHSKSCSPKPSENAWSISRASIEPLKVMKA